MKNALTKRWMIPLIGLMLLFNSCQSNFDEYYELPSWLNGNAWEVLEGKGNYSLFLEGVDKVGYKALVNGKGVITVMAPSDSAMQVYMKANGYSSIDNWYTQDPQGLSSLITYHLIYYSFDKDMFMDYKPDGVESDKENLEAGLYFKFRTKSRDLTETVTDPISGKTLSLLHKEKFLPVLSENLFITKGIATKYNYEYFYPSTTWSGSDGFMVSNASVNDYAISTDNGYVYTINKVLEPLKTVYSTMAANSNYSDFKSIYDKFINYTYDAQGTADYGNGDSLYLHYFNSLPQIASEWSVNGTNDYKELGPLSKNGFNAFAPSNSALESFFNSFFKPYGYSSLTDLNFTPLNILILSHVNTGSLVFPEEISKGNIIASDGSTVSFNPSNVNAASMCSNGCFYGLNGMITSPYFTSVSGAVLQNPDYKIFMEIIKGSGYLTSLTSQTQDFHFFIPDDNILADYTTIDGKKIQYVNSTPLVYNSDEVQIEGDNVDWESMSTAIKKIISGVCIGAKQIGSLGDEIAYRTLNSFDYVFTNRSKIYSTHAYNTDHLSSSTVGTVSVPTFSKIDETWTNGTAYKMSGEASSPISETRTFKEIFSAGSDAECPTYFKLFHTLFLHSSLAATTPAMSFLQGERYILLVPTDAVVTAGIKAKTIPTSAGPKIDSFFKGYFVSISQSGLSDYLFPGQSKSGTLATYKTNDSGETCNLKYSSTSTGLTFSDGTNTVNAINTFPYVYADCAVYYIDGLLDAE